MWPADGKENRNDERAALGGIARFVNAEDRSRGVSRRIRSPGSRSQNKRLSAIGCKLSRTAHSAVRRQSRRLVNDLAVPARGAGASYQGSISCGHAFLVRSRMEAGAAMTLTRLTPLMDVSLAGCICVDPRGPVTGRYAGSRTGPVLRRGAQTAAQRIEQDRGTQDGRGGVRDRRREAKNLGCQQEQCRADSADHNRTGRVVQSPLKHFAPLCAPGALCTIQG